MKNPYKQRVFEHAKSVEKENIMGEEETLLAGAFKVTWTPYTSSRFDSARFKKEHAELAEAYTKTTTARRFSVR